MLTPRTPVFATDIASVVYRASRAPTLVDVTIWSRYRGGIERQNLIISSFTADRSSVTVPFPRRFKYDGEIAELSVRAIGVGNRGTFFMQVMLGQTPGDSPGQRILAVDYLYRFHSPILGRFVDPGPGGGNGNLRWVPAFTANRAGNAAAVDFPLFASNALRKVYGVVWYYHCDGTVATRVVVVPYLSGLGGTKPTGFTLTGTNAHFWTFGGNLSLTANEEGLFASYGPEGKDGRTIQNDAGSQTVTSSATSPTPWPLLVTEDDTDTIIRFPAITDGVATDTHSAYVLIEEWLEEVAA